ncbi:MAG: valine--tRNA ligase [Candidatus Helarchaeota archaeon]
MPTFKMPKNFNFSEIEAKWIKKWKEEGIYKFDISENKPIYSIDTPPPFTSGTLHMGHILNHTWIDIAARFKRMTGYNVYFPQGFDCHGLPTELKVEKEFKVSKDNKSLFLEKCIEWTEEAISQMMRQFDEMGYSTDWNKTYKTMDKEYLRLVQSSLIYFYEKGWLYRKKFPIHWCVKCRTALAKQEVGYIDEEGHLWYIKMPLANGNDYVTIATTRPEMMPACVAVLINPDDSRYYKLSGKKIKLPIFGREVEIIQDSDVDMEFGTGIVYLCTFGDETDIKWQTEYDLPVIQVIDEKGIMTDEAGKYKGQTIEEARKNIIKDLKDLNLIEKVEKHPHRVIVHTERSSCLNPIEYLPIEQYFIKIKPFKDEILKAAESMNWYPPNMIKRLIDWIESLDWDWVISRQRVFGTPIPFWHCTNCDQLIPAQRNNLPIDPNETKPPVDKCPKCGGEIEATSDVCDCWVDSSVTPLVISKWETNDEYFKKTYPSTMRPQGYEIIRTWAFYTIFRCLKLTDKPCFKELMINGMVAGTDGRKMSKSFGNVVAPEEPLQKYGADALRQWAAMGTLGDDYPYTLKELEYSFRFLRKLWNACRFTSPNLVDFNINEIKHEDLKLRYVDSWILYKLNNVIETAKRSLEVYNFRDALTSFRQFFWHDFCDDYLEAVKYRIYNPIDSDLITAKYILYYVILNSLKIFAPFAPFITEEIYNLLFISTEGNQSIHLSSWPETFKNLNESFITYGELAINIIKKLRDAKAKRRLALSKPISLVYIQGSEEIMKELEPIKEVIAKTIKIGELKTIKEIPKKQVNEIFEIDDPKLKIGWKVE